MRPDTSWQRRAACLNADPDIFFATRLNDKTHRKRSQAFALCDTCPVREPCLNAALARPERHGIWGGMSATQRIALLKELKEQGETR